MDLMLIIEMLPKIFEFLPFLNPDLKFMIGNKSFCRLEDLDGSGRREGGERTTDAAIRWKDLQE
jgi:hypothetical protein